jgi:succinoglycan biosynthesis protein ExoM
MTGFAHVSVCIATHRRPAGLERLLRSLAAQEGAPAFEVVVVDNDARRSGEAVARHFSDRLDLIYLAEPIRGISRARNRAVAESRGSFLAFIDDDTWATPRWLASLDAKAEEFFADVVIGPVTILFAENVPDYIRSCCLFDRAVVADGTAVPRYLAHTNNSYVRRSALLDQTSPFASAFDLTGGEDVDLFSRMIDHGALVVGTASAGVFEDRPAHRANLRWVFRRALRNGTLFAGTERSRMSTRHRVSLGLGASSRAIACGISGIAAWRKDRRIATDRLITMADEIGKIAGLFGYRVQEYRNHS